MFNFRRIIKDCITSEENSKMLGEGLIKTVMLPKNTYVVSGFFHLHTNYK